VPVVPQPQVFVLAGHDLVAVALEKESHLASTHWRQCESFLFAHNTRSVALWGPVAHVYAVARECATVNQLDSRHSPADAYRAWRARNILYTRMVPEDILAEVLGAAASYGIQTLHANLRHLHSPLSAGIMNRAQPGRVGAGARHDPECSASVSEHAVAIQKRTRRAPA
jgi:hypothetical protein